MEEKKQKRVLSIELDENVKKVSITGLGDDETVVMKQELTEEELDQATGGFPIQQPGKCGSYHGGCQSHGCQSHVPKIEAHGGEYSGYYDNTCPKATHGIGCPVNY